MSETPVKIIIDLSKPKGERESIIPLTQAEIDERDALALIAAEEQLQREAEEQALLDLKESAKAKLIAGEPLTAAEADTLVL
jgi:hypothetical protein